jgi:hypothetical protein
LNFHSSGQYKFTAAAQISCQTELHKNLGISCTEKCCAESATPYSKTKHQNRNIFVVLCFEKTKKRKQKVNSLRKHKKSFWWFLFLGQEKYKTQDSKQKIFLVFSFLK